ncbi:hypothetical protein [Streptomyces sp. NPDC050287]|uniref:hypothetical protein n=1 Tax=Streptomyces sp. NPDC050287 TaxID=3365608 RepID=UPI0037A3DA9E
MTNFDLYAPAPAGLEDDIEGDLEGDLASLRGDCARMVPHWSPPARIASRPVSPSLIHGVSVPAASARLLDAMSEYGD